MKLPSKRTEEEKTADAAAKAERQRVEQIEKQRTAFLQSPAGRAEMGYKRGDQDFQYSHNVMSQQAIVVKMVGARTSQGTTDPVDILNSVCREGWDLVNGSFVFVEQGQESRDKFMSSGQNIAIKGAVVGYYLFRRCEENRREVANPWETV
jgi:hypothetical protein